MRFDLDSWRCIHMYLLFIYYYYLLQLHGALLFYMSYCISLLSVVYVDVMYEGPTGRKTVVLSEQS